MSIRTFTYDVIVVGAGLSGLMAASAAAEKGASVAVLAEGAGMLELSSGSVDLLAGCENPWAAMAALPAEHPYALVGPEAVRRGLGSFLALLDGTYTERPDQRNQHTATAVGALRTTYLTAPGAPVIEAGKPVWVVGLTGLKEFNPAVVAAGLGGAAHSRVDAGLPGGLHPIQVARLLDEPAHRRNLAQALAAARPAGVEGGIALLPGVLGLNRSKELLAELRAALRMEVGEVPLPAPSLPGLRLAATLGRLLQRRGVELISGVLVTGANHSAGRVTGLVARTPAGPAEFRAGAVVLAAGGLLGRGLVEGADRSLTEPIFGLPVVAPGQPWAQPDLLAPGGHAFVRAGIATDGHLRPAGWENLFLCGRMLAGYDPYAEGCGGGVAIATGTLAGSLAGGAA